jgi:hypothetical protein
MSDPTLPAVAAPPGWMTFEFPCNERIRSLLRIESLFKRCKEFNEYPTAFGHQAAISNPNCSRSSIASGPV